jgi:SanA protein
VKRGREDSIRRRFGRMLRRAKYPLVALLLFIVWCNYQVIQSADRAVHDSLEELPERRTGLVLGTSKYLLTGGINPYFRHRVEAAAALYRSGKVEYLLVSGDGRSEPYNEPRYFSEALAELGIPEKRIIRDRKGLSTIDSVLRCGYRYGEVDCIIVTQRFHAQRALYLAHNYGMDRAVGYAAMSVSSAVGLKVLFREIFARVKAVLEVHLLPADVQRYEERPLRRR